MEQINFADKGWIVRKVNFIHVIFVNDTDFFKKKKF